MISLHLEKAQEKRVLIEKNETLRSELSQLESRAEQLTAALQGQRETQTEMLEKQRQTEQNIRRLLDFLNAIKGHPPPASPTPPPSAPPSTQESEAAQLCSAPCSPERASPIRSLSPTNSDEPEFEIVETDAEPVTLTPICSSATAHPVSVSEGSWVRIVLVCVKEDEAH